ncbi:MAG: CdaR family protein [Sarcina ventriculi]|nr:CdaR family protein [Sarcina ventriculi]MDD7372342.1 CdaR family protein [Sarcina ventriculi]MDY7061442.1 CdaR family protein [Sarcina ventriculi]
MGKNNKKRKIISQVLKIVKEKNLMVKLVCLLLSFGLWIYISNIENPIKQYTITNIPVQIVNLDVLKEDNLTLAPDQNFTISLTIQGTSTNIYSINKSQFTAVANLSNYTLKSGDNSIPVEITNSPNNVNIKNNGVLRINIKLENITEKTMPVKSELNVTTSNSTYVKNISFSTNQITVSGPEETVNEVSKLVVRGNVTANNSTTTASFPVVAVDSSGNVVNDVVLSTNNVQTTITVEKGKLVPIKVQTTGELRAGLTLENIIANPNTIKILGSESVLDSTDEILSEPINLNSITGNETIITNLIVPRNITLLPNENEINVDVKVSGADENNSENVVNGNTETTKTFEIPITIEGNLSGYTANLSSNTVTVVLKGTKKELDNLQASNLSCKVDVSKLTKEGGVVSPTVDINNENNVLVDSQNPQTVDVTFTKAEE